MGEEGDDRDEMVGWHHGLDGHASQQALGVRDGQGGLSSLYIINILIYMFPSIFSHIYMLYTV